MFIASYKCRIICIRRRRRERKRISSVHVPVPPKYSPKTAAHLQIASPLRSASPLPLLVFCSILFLPLNTFQFHRMLYSSSYLPVRIRFNVCIKKKKKEISHTRLEKATLSTYDISQKRIRRRVGWARELKIILCIIKSDCKGNFQIKYVKYKLNLFIHLSIIAQERSLNPKLDEQNLMWKGVFVENIIRGWKSAILN